MAVRLQKSLRRLVFSLLVCRRWSPLAPLTGYYEMNVQELVPVLLVCTVGLGYVTLRLYRVVNANKDT